MNPTASTLLAVAFAFALTACGKNPDDGAKQTKLVLEQPPHADLNASGRPEAPWIDPQKNTVVVLAAPSAPQLVERQQTQLAAERGKVETHIHDLMDGYAANLRNPAGKAKYQEEIAQELATYKRQTLQLYKLQRQSEQANGQPN
jgi:hypothetical protein